MSRSFQFISHHPFEFISPVWWPRIFWMLLGLTLFLIILFGITGSTLATEASPYGVISLELAGSVERVQQILSSWDSDTQLRAVFGLGLDYLFLAVYTSTIAFGCGITAQVLQRSGWPLSHWGNLLSWIVILAAVLDVIENIALTIIIFGNIISPWPEIARGCAILKFILVFIGIVYVIYGGVVALVERISTEE